jgi:cell division protein FtsA
LTILELPRSEYKSLVPGGLVLTGGSSNLSGMDVLGRDMLKMPVRIGSPLNMQGIAEALRDPSYATGVGLLLWGAKLRRSALSRPRRGLFGNRIKKLVTQFAGLFRQ